MPADRLIRLLSLRSHLQERLPEFLRARRWFGGKARPIREIEILDAIPYEAAEVRACFLLVRVHYQSGSSENYSVPLVEAGDPASAPAFKVPAGDNSGEMVLHDAMSNLPFLASLLPSIREERSFHGQRGVLRAIRSAFLERAAGTAGELAPRVIGVEQSNSSAAYGDRLILKMFRRVEDGINPDLEIGWYLTERTGFRNVPPVAGYLEYSDAGSCMSLAMLQSFVTNSVDAWEFTLAAVQQYFQRVLPATASLPELLPRAPAWEMAQHELPGAAEQLAGDYLDSARLLGRRTAELHLALASSSGHPAFDPEPFSAANQQALCQGILGLLQTNFLLLRLQQPGLPSGMQEEAEHVLDLKAELEQQLQWMQTRPLAALRTRIHGDYHLGQVLVSGGDFVIIDFEGEPARPLAQRRSKRSPLQDVAGMLRSFHYAAYAPLLRSGASGDNSLSDAAAPWAYCWQRWVSAAFLRSYLQTSGTAPHLPHDPAELAVLLKAHLIEKAVYELGYELNNRPGWVRIPLSGIRQLAA